MNSQYQDYKKAGLILSKALDLAISLTTPGEKLIDIAEKVEDFIRKNSAQPAFPLNISCNEIAAHYSPIVNDQSIIPDKAIVKIDGGVTINGYIADAARTIVFDDEWIKLKESSDHALTTVLKEIKPNSSIYRVGETVEREIRRAGFLPIINLSGHSLSRYSLHGGISIPNYSIPKKLRHDEDVFKPGHVYAIEPFATPGVGKVFDGEKMTIFRQFRSLNSSSLPNKIQKIYNLIEREYNNLPFSWRWVFNSDFTLEEVERAKKILSKKKIIHGYPILIEASHKPVTQKEETILIGTNKIHILTKSK